MKARISFLFMLLVFIRSYAQDVQDAPTAAPAIKTFALEPDIAGAASNSVNLFTGDVALPLNLVSLPGRNGLDVNVSIAYSSNVQNTVDTWNLEAPAGILGLGWSMDIPKIVADHKQTGTRVIIRQRLIMGRVIRGFSLAPASSALVLSETTPPTRATSIHFSAIHGGMTLLTNR